jgi:DNA-binding response OmpR family regulator
MKKGRKTALVIEDSQVQCAALSLLLRREGLQVLCASNGRAGVSMAQQHVPDVIVLDIEMSGMNGFEVCRRLKENAQTASIPIVMLTVRHELTALMQGIDLGAIDFIPKDDFSYAVLLETLRQLHILE